MKPTSREQYRLKLMAQFCQGARKILDVGLYYPNYYISQYAPENAKIIGFDIAKIRLPKSYHSIVCGDVQELDRYFRPNTFDVILLGELIEHIENPYQTLKKCHRVLKAGGKIIISTPNPLGFPRLFFEYFSIKKYFYHKNHLFMFIPRWLEKMIIKSGFDLIGKIGLAFYFPIKLPTILSDQVIYIARKK